MKIQYASDLHLEFPENVAYLSRNPLKPQGEVLILAGDLAPLDHYHRSPAFFDLLASEWEQVFILPGNHEYYGGHDVFPTPLNEALRPNVHLVNNITLTYGGVRLVFSTLWSRIQQQYAFHITHSLSDFRRIRSHGVLLTVETYNQLFQQSYKFLEGAVEDAHLSPTLVVTHHLPSGLCNAPEFAGSPLNEAFCTELHDFIYSSGVAYWIYGHSHRNVGPVQINGTQLLTNQLGYVHMGEHRSFMADAFLEM